MLKLVKAFFIMMKAHRGQKDKAGKPYYRHPLKVAIGVKGLKAKTVALLHDVIEDNKKYSIDLFDFLDSEQKEALLLLTHDKTDGYFSYINRIKSNRIAKSVKVKDLEHNSNLRRLKEITQKDIERVEKYKRAMLILSCQKHTDNLLL